MHFRKLEVYQIAIRVLTLGADQRRFFAIARGSAMECAALVDGCRALGVAEAAQLDELDARLLSVVRMLSKLAR